MTHELDLNHTHAEQNTQSSPDREIFRDLRQEMQHLNRAVWQLNESVRPLNGQIDKFLGRSTATRTIGIDHSDPKGYYKSLGIDPELARTLPPDRLKKLIDGAYRLYASVHHPDVDGDVETMKRINDARDFLSDPLNRRNYGQRV